MDYVLPANDFTRDGWYLLLTPEEDRIRCSWHRLSYVAEQAQQKMVAAGLKAGYSDALLSGLWPSLDVLPEIERSRRGLPVEMADLVF